MRAAFYNAGFDVYDVTMEDLISKQQSLSGFTGITFVGGFSYSDVLRTGKMLLKIILLLKRI